MTPESCRLGLNTMILLVRYHIYSRVVGHRIILHIILCTGWVKMYMGVLPPPPSLHFFLYLRQELLHSLNSSDILALPLPRSTSASPPPVQPMEVVLFTSILFLIFSLSLSLSQLSISPAGSLPPLSPFPSMLQEADEGRGLA